jgi:hypothetical protein
LPGVRSEEDLPVKLFAILSLSVAAMSAPVQAADTVVRQGDKVVFSGLGISAPAKLAGCEDAVLVPPDGLIDAVVQYACANSVTISIWTRTTGWRDVADAIDAGHQMLPEDGEGWLTSDEPARKAAGGQALTVGVGFSPTDARRWLTPTGPKPKVIIEQAWSIVEPGADEEAERALKLLLASADLVAGK